MNHSQNDNHLHIATGVKAAVLVSVLALIAMVADQSFVVPAEVPAMGASLSAVPYEATALTADGRGGDATTQANPAQSGAAPAKGLYPEPAGDAVRDPDGHPASF
jgi:hypothetical protein